MTDIPLPTGGGSYIREKDGSLRLVEEPTARAPDGGPVAEAAPEAPLEAPLEAPVEGPVNTPVKPARKEA